MFFRFLPDGRLATAATRALIWSVALETADSTEELTALWTTLSDPDPKAAWPAMAKLAGRGTSAVEFIRTRVPVVPRIKEGTIERIVKSLDAAGFNQREAASTELDRLGSSAIQAIKLRMKAGVSEEAQTRIERFLAKHDRPELQPEELQALRAVEVLEAIGNVDAKKVIDSLATGEPERGLLGKLPQPSPIDESLTCFVGRRKIVTSC